MSTLVAALVGKYRLDTIPRVVQVKCLSVSPFQVAIEGGDEPVSALRVADQTFNVNDLGLAVWAPPLAPICFKTT